MPERYSAKHIGLALSLSLTSHLLDAWVLHNAIYALFIGVFGWGFWDTFIVSDEPVFFIVGLFAVPAGLVVGLVGRVWEWAVIQPIKEMNARGILLPDKWFHFVPFSSYIWVWEYGRSIEIMTQRRIRAAGVFTAVLFLGIIGFLIIRRIMYRQSH